jgi:DNA-binding MarR family transcriptional regulator
MLDMHTRDDRKMAERLNERQIAILIIIASLEGEATVKEIERMTNLSVQSIRNILSELTRLGLIASNRGLGAKIGLRIGLLGKGVERKEALYTLNKDFEGIIKEHLEILEWSKKNLHADSVDSLKKELKKIKSVLQDEEKDELLNIIKKLKTEGGRSSKGLAFPGMSKVPEEELLEFIEEIERRKKIKQEKE